jgi:hypothetical protein
MSKAYVYVVDRDFGFAPNPFQGVCTLATCKPGIRCKAEIGDWVIGMGGSRLGATGRCIFAMRVSKKITFDEYWSGPEYLDKKPVRNGSRKMMVGDNIYHYDAATKTWHQADSHHSNADGSANTHNVAVDTKTNRVLISDHFFYFGSAAALVPSRLLASMGYENGRNYRVFDEGACAALIEWLHASFSQALNLVSADPFDFNSSEKRYSAHDNKIK